MASYTSSPSAFAKELTKAVKRNDEQRLSTALRWAERGDFEGTLGNLKRRDWGYFGPLQQASLMGRNNMVQALVNAGVDINSYASIDSDNRSTGDHRGTALHFAVLGKRELTTMLLLELGADARRKGMAWLCPKRGLISETPLEWAVRRKRVAIAAMLQEHVDLLPDPPEPLEEAFEPHEAAAATVVIPTPITNTDKITRLRKEMDLVEKEIKKLVERRGQIADELSVLEERGDDAKEGEKSASCPICFKTPRQVFSCVNCDNWVCGYCRAKLVACPICREDLLAYPPLRNRTVERVLGL